MFNLRTTYNVKEIFYTIQGEGEHAGRAAVFCRFSGCNGWSGLQRDREKGPFHCSRWCDTDFVNGSKYQEDDLVSAILKLFPKLGFRLVVFTGGEPALQLTDSLIDKLIPHVPMICIETNGSLALPAKALSNCWITVSPKTPKVLQDKANEIKLIYPTIDPSTFDYIKTHWRFLQPLHDKNLDRNTRQAIEYVKANPEWKLSLQIHKFANIP